MDQLGNSDLTDCRMVNPFWKNCIDSQKVLWMRVIYRWLPEIYQGWQNIHKILNVDMVRTLANGVQKFYTGGSDDSEEFYTPLEIAAIIGNTEIVAKLFKKEVFENQGSLENHHGSPFHYAAISGHLEVCELFVRFTTDINPKGHHGRTVLHCAAKNGHLDICQLLVNNISDKNPKDDDGTTPLGFANEKGVAAPEPKEESG